VPGGVQSPTLASEASEDDDVADDAAFWDGATHDDFAKNFDAPSSAAHLLDVSAIADRQTYVARPRFAFVHDDPGRRGHAMPVDRPQLGFDVALEDDDVDSGNPNQVAGGKNDAAADGGFALLPSRFTRPWRAFSPLAAAVRGVLRATTDATPTDAKGEKAAEGANEAIPGDVSYAQLYNTLRRASPEAHFRTQMLRAWADRLVPPASTMLTSAA
jgi:hypothetical protein